MLYITIPYAEVFPSQFIYINKKLLLTPLFINKSLFTLTFSVKQLVQKKFYSLEPNRVNWRKEPDMVKLLRITMNLRQLNHLFHNSATAF